MAELMRLAKYLKKFTDVQQFAYLVSIQRGQNRMLGFFLGDGGWEEVDNGRIGWSGVDTGKWEAKGEKLLLGGAVDRWMAQGLFSVPVLIFAIMCFSICVTYWQPNTVKTTLHSGQGYSPPTGDPGAAWSPQHSVEPREIVEQHPRRATTSKRCFF